MKTAEQINEKTQGSKRRINKEYRRMDDSDLWPIRGRFNVTERAIRKARAFQRNCGEIDGLEYCYLLESIISEIESNPKNQ